MTRHAARSLLAFALCIFAGASTFAGSAEHALLQPRDLGAGWEVVREAPADPRSDPDLRRWGVVEQHVRHYTRDLRGRIQVCSVEVWGFASQEQASAAGRGFQYPDWQISSAGSLLVMARGLVRMRGRRPIRGVFPDCADIATRIRERAASH